MLLETFKIQKDVTYILDNYDNHTFKALTDVVLIFVVLTPLTLLPEIARLENDKNGNTQYDGKLAAEVNKLSKVVFASPAECWLISCPDMATDNTILLAEQDKEIEKIVGPIQKKDTKIKIEKDESVIFWTPTGPIEQSSPNFLQIA